MPPRSHILARRLSVLEQHTQQNQPEGVPPLSLTGERTLPDVPAENYWYRRHLVVYRWIAERCRGLDVVDVHAFTPAQLDGFARRAGFRSVRVSGEELVAGWFGWANRTLESTAESRQIPALWYQYAYRGYMALKALDDHLLEPALPPAIFYNLLVSAEVPPAGEIAEPVAAPQAAAVTAAR